MHSLTSCLLTVKSGKMLQVKTVVTERGKKLYYCGSKSIEKALKQRGGLLEVSQCVTRGKIRLKIKCFAICKPGLVPRYEYGNMWYFTCHESKGWIPTDERIGTWKKSILGESACGKALCRAE